MLFGPLPTLFNFIEEKYYVSSLQKNIYKSIFKINLCIAFSKKKDSMKDEVNETKHVRNKSLLSTNQNIN